MNLRTLICTESDCYKAGKTITPVGIVVHSTGANNPNLKRYVGPDDGLLGVNKYNNHWNVPGKSVCPHAAIGKLADGSIATYQLLPWMHRSWTAGKGKNGSANATHINFEICEDGLESREYFEAVYKEAVELCAYLCEKFELNPLEDGVVIDHKEAAARGLASNHGDVAHWFPKFGKSMDTLRADVAALLKPTQDATATEPAEKPVQVQFVKAKDYARYYDNSLKGTYRVTASALNVRHGAGIHKSRMVTIQHNKTVKCYGYYSKWLGAKWLFIAFWEGDVYYEGFAHSKYLAKL